MTYTTYLRYELLRTFRNRRFFIFSFGFPLALYYIIAGPSSHSEPVGSTGISAPLYFMVSVSSFGTMTAMMSTGGRIAAERATGWNRQLRISPLSARNYFRAKVVTGYGVAILSILILYAAGVSLGVSMPLQRWLHMTALILIGLIPFAALGILIGHIVPSDSIGPAVGGGTSLLAIISGTWFPIGNHGVIHDIAQVLPSYYLVQAGRVGIGGSPWGATGWVVIAVWTVILTALARRAYLRDTGRA
ncbi:MAG: transporter permease [Solirubrobacteraceae bacterium]|nr:transporter permease [Solirubrobacteraceae bacterium]